MSSRFKIHHSFNFMWLSSQEFIFYFMEQDQNEPFAMEVVRLGFASKVNESMISNWPLISNWFKILKLIRRSQFVLRLWITHIWIWPLVWYPMQKRETQFFGALDSALGYCKKMYVLPVFMADCAKPVSISVSASLSIFSARFAHPNFAGSTKGPTIHDPTELGPATTALSRRVNISGPAKKWHG